MKENITIKIDNLIVLCNTIDNFPKFNRNLRKYTKDKDFIEVIYKLERVINETYTDRILKEFYKDNKKMIDNIQKYSSLSDFMYDCYEEDGSTKNNLFKYFNYLQKNINNINHIIILLYHLKYLGFTNITLNENNDFTNEMYEVSSDFSKNNNITYLDNMHLVFNDSENIKYMTTHSDYKIILKRFNNNFPPINRKIIVNNLLFDYTKLPKNIDRENIFDEIINLGYYKELNDLSNEDKKIFLIKLRNNIDKIINNLESQNNITLKKD